MWGSYEGTMSWIPFGADYTALPNPYALTLTGAVTASYDGSEAVSVEIPKGIDGVTPTIGDNGNWYLGTTDTGKPSRGEKGDKGDKGDQGEQGLQGVQGATGATGNGIASATINEYGELVIVYTNGDNINLGKVIGAKGEKGDKGDTGATGAAGYTPIRGIDYWTKADKEEINADNISYIQTEFANRIAQATGDSTDTVMSQKASTVEINALKSDITELQTALIGVSDLIGGDA